MPKGEPFEAVIAEPGDNLRSLAQRAFGTGGAWPYLGRLNNLSPTFADYEPEVGSILITSGTRPIPTRWPGRSRRYEGETPWG